MRKPKFVPGRISYSPQSLDIPLIVNNLGPNQAPNRDKDGTNQNLSDINLYAILTDLSERKKMKFLAPVPNKDYRCCQLSQGQEWFVYFYVRSPKTGKLQRVRYKINRIHNVKDRKKWALKMMDALDQRLTMGWNPLLEEAAPKSMTGMFAALDDFLAAKSKESEENTMRSYRSFVANLKKWLRLHRFTDTSMVASFTDDMATALMTEVEDQVGAKTYNNYLNFYKGLFIWLQNKGYAVSNPFAKFSKKPRRLTKKKRRLLTDAELQRLFDYCKQGRPEHYPLCLMTYCCLVRPKELALLKCADVDIERQRVHIRAEIAKNDNDSYRTIPSVALDAFKKLDLSHPEYYLFGKNKGTDNFSPAMMPICSRKIANWWNAYVRPACGFGQDVQFYSLKDTGITNMLVDGVPINLVQQQADHYSVAMTAVYVGRIDATEGLKTADILPNNRKK